MSAATEDSKNLTVEVRDDNNAPYTYTFEYLGNRTTYECENASDPPPALQIVQVLEEFYRHSNGALIGRPFIKEQRAYITWAEFNRLRFAKLIRDDQLSPTLNSYINPKSNISQ